MNKTFTKLLIFLFALMPMVVSGSTTWDFAGKGFSDATLANLAADNTRWSVANNTSGTAVRYANAASMSGELTANGVTIAETAGIKFGTIGAGKIDIDFGYVPPRVMLNGASLTFTIPDLVAGQTITIVTMTANTTSSRGISCTTNNATRTAGDATSLDEITNVFVVNEDVETASDVTFKTVTGGVHIRSIVVSGNSDFDPDGPVNIAYLYDSSYGDGSTIVGTDNDAILQSGLMQKNVYSIDLKNFTSETDQVFKDTLAALESNYNVVVVSSAIAETHPFAKKLENLINRIPMLNMNAAFYNSDSWNLGALKNPTDVSNGGAGVTSMVVKDGFSSHPIFADQDLSEGLVLFDGTVTNKNLVQGYTLNSGGLYDKDSLLTVVVNGTDSINSIHKHGTDNAYMLIPLCSDAISTISEGTISFIYNAAIHLASTKTEVTTAIKPTISLNYQDAHTLVTMTSATTDASIYYTTDGSDPKIAGTLYTEALNITDSCTVKAFTVKQGYDTSAVTTSVVLVKTQLPAPAIEVIAPTSIGGSTNTVTITASDEASIYYTINGATPAAASATLYSEPLVINRPCRVKAIAVKDGYLDSEIATDTVVIEGYVARNKTLAWANFYDQPSTWTWAKTDTSTAVSGDVIPYYAYDSTTPHDSSVTFTNGFKVGTLGQRINLQTTGVANSGNYSPYTDGDTGASNYAMSFLTTKASTDPTSAYMITPKAYRGPIDVAAWFTGGKANTAYTEKLEISVATDPTGTWTVLDTVSSLSDKFIRKYVVHYDGSDSVYVKLASVSNIGTNSNMMIFDMKVMGQGEDPVVSVETPVMEKTIVATRIYTISGLKVRQLVSGLNIVQTIYSDGSVDTKKVLLCENGMKLN